MIYIAHSFALPSLVPALSAALLPSEQLQAESYQSPQRALQYLAGRGLLRWLVCQTQAVAAEQVVITRAENGAPLLTIKGEPWSCSISHKSGAVMVAYTRRGTLGIDIEEMRLRKRHEELIDAFAEGFMRGVSVADRAQFYQRWTLAEAVTKARQGKLLATLREAPEQYLAQARFVDEAQHMLCIYAAKSVGDGRSQWWQVTVTDTQQLFISEVR
ncbi:hypothetical protein CWI80_09500 [Pseudidiomarina sediminum]|uniref:4'-phosphopantetheinyl transferase N-terminal domain-containing protein n=1 Tax=Pseudidiomarina sediminum TaxID=431675 RepID=A0A432Z2G1_9GAMM|nr:4'-phosphopantetheinyl transferase superfamily protein [Pseudidiomarina sediminum]MBY6064354.1 hypothetical protein [Pseudidiomarina sediminum]RUO72029.1 hypothetical protein CWI80_09500 [Pseudidiomarina sediminum]